MQKLFRSILSASRKLRCSAVGIALWLLRSVRDVEKDDMYRYSDKLDQLDLHPESVSKREYAAIEEEYSECEYALGVLDYAIEDLVCTYYSGRF